MKKYNGVDSYESDLEAMVGDNERIMWRGKPDKKCFILESIFNPLLPFALVWCVFDLVVLGISFSDADIDPTDVSVLVYIAVFVALHMMPVWIYIGGVIMSSRKYRNTAYIITDRGIYISSGLFSKRFEMKPFTDLSHINVRRGIFDQFLDVGDVVTICSHDSYSSADSHANSNHGMTICDIRDYKEVFKLIKDLQTDVYSDTMYPNDLRPESNHGYKTKYKGLEQ